MHFGKITFDVDERGELGLLTRNIKLQASADAEQSFYGGPSWRWLEARCLSRASSSIAWARTRLLPGIRRWLVLDDCVSVSYFSNSRFGAESRRSQKVGKDVAPDSALLFETSHWAFWLEWAEFLPEASLKIRKLSQPKLIAAIGKAIAPTYIPFCRWPARLGPKTLM